VLGWWLGALAAGAGVPCASAQAPSSALPQTSSPALPQAPASAPQAAAQAPAEPPQISDLQARVDRAAQQMESDPQAAIEALDHLAVESAELRKTRVLTAEERPAHRQVYILRARAHLLAMTTTRSTRASASCFESTRSSRVP